jgi:hypothetical protein
MIGEKRVKYRIKYHVFKKVLSRISKIIKEGIWVGD